MESERTIESEFSEAPIDNLSSRLIAATERYVASFARLQAAKSECDQLRTELGERMQGGGQTFSGS